MALVPIEKLVKNLESQGMCRIIDYNTRNVIPTRKTSWVNLSLREIITKYNLLLTDLFYYYSFAYNRCQLKFIQYLIQHSAACTIMNKMKISSRRKVFKKFGTKLEVEEEGILYSLNLHNSFKKMKNILSKSAEKS